MRALLMRELVLRYSLAPGCVLAAVLVHFSPAGPLLPPAGPFVFAVMGAAWFGGPGPGFLAALLGALAMPQLFTVTTPLVGGVLDLHRFVAFALMGIALGWGSALRARKLSEQERYATAMESSADGFWDWIPATNTVYASPRLLEIYGFPPGTIFAGREDLVQRIPFHPEDRQRMASAIAEHFAGKLARLDIPMRFTRGGETRWVQLTAVAARGASGTVVRWTGTVRDITEQKRVEEALRESERRHELAMNAGDEGFWDWMPDGDRLYLSPRFLEIFGFAPGTTFAGRIAMIDAWAMAPEDRAALYRTVAEHFAGKTPRMDAEFRVLVGGEVRWIHAKGLATRNEQGEVVRWNGAASDITARKRAEDELRDSEARFRSLTELSSDWYWRQDESHRFTYLSRQGAETEHYPNEWMLGKTRWELPGVTLLSSTWEEHKTALKARWPFRELEYSRVGRGGRVEYLSISGAPIFDEQGEFRGYQGVGRNITARKRAEQALLGSEQRYALAMEAAGDGHTDWDLVTGKFYISPRLLEIIGHSPGATFADRADWVRRFPFHPEDRPKWEAAVAAHLAGPESHFKMELRIVVRDEVRWTSFHFLSTRDAAGKPIRWTGSIGDITEQKRVEEALRASEERISLAMEASEEGYIDCDVQTDRFIVSERMREIFEVSPGTRITYRSDFNEQFRFCSDEDAKAYGDAMRTMSAPGGPDRHEFEFRVVLPSGKVKWIWTRSKVTRDAEGRALRRIGVVADVTARKLAEEGLRTSEDRFARAVDGSYDGVWDLDFVARTAYSSARTRELCGLRSYPETVSLDDWVKALPIHPEDWPRRNAAFQAHLSGKVPVYEGEFRVLQPDGVYRWRHLHGVCVRDADGKPLRMAGSISDVDDRRRAEGALRDSEERYERVVAATEAGFWDWDVTQDRYYVSPRLLEMGGLPPDTVIAGRADFQARVPLHPEDLLKWQQEIGELFASGGSRLSTELRVMNPAGARWVQLDGMCFRDAAGKVVRWTGSAIDVTPRKLAEEALRESEKRHERVVDASDDGYWDWIPAGDRMYASRRLREIYGIAPDAKLANRADFMARLPFHPEDRARLMQGFAEHLAGKGSRYKIEARILRNGETQWVQIAGLADRDRSGVLVRWTGTVRDITELKSAEEALRKSEQRYELAMAASESGYWDWDVATGRYFVSPRAYELAGFPPGTTWVNRDDYRKHINMHPEDFARWEAARQALFAGTGERLAMEVRYMVKGEPHWHLLNAICRRDAAGKVIRWTGSATDITERKRAEQGLESMERKLRLAQRLEAMGTLAGGIAHDFNNILGAILGYGEMAQRDAAKGSRLARDLDSIMVAGERGRALVDRVLAFSRSAVGERVPVHVERVVREALDQVSAKLPPGVTVHPRLRAGIAAILGDATQVHQVVANLANNAVQAMPAGGTLRVDVAAERLEAPRSATIGSREAGEYVVLTVADSGTGIAPEIADRIFDPFFTTKEVGTGTGLGLSLVHGIVTELGGAIDVASTPGGGATFKVYLPRSGDAAEPDDEKESALPRGKGQRVLVVDDEEPLVRLATRTLEDLGYVPAGFTSSTAALDAFRADPERFDALVTDERMPGMSGSALIREVRGMRRAMPVVLMSGYMGTAAGEADEVLQKPLSARDLAASLARVLRARRSAGRRASSRSSKRS